MLLTKVYLRFEWLAGWRVRFLDEDKILPCKLLFQTEEKLLEMAGRGGALKTLADRQGQEHAVRIGRGGLYLDHLSHSQFSALQRTAITK